MLNLPKARVYGGGSSGGGALSGRIRTDGRFFVTDAGTFRPRFAMQGTILTLDPAARDAQLDEVAGRFNGLRCFAGALAWAGLTVEQSRANLPGLLDAAAARGLYVYVSALTDSGTGYDVETHLTAIAAICAAHENAILEVANEVGHPTQSALVNDPARLLSLARRVIPATVTWCLGSPTNSVDEILNGTFPTFGGDFDDAHLDRGRPFFEQVRRVREIAGISETSHKAVMSGEPMGAAEASIPGKREADPTFFWTLGLLCRAFEVGGVFHSEDGLNARPLGSNQQRCADAYVEGSRVIPTGARLSFQNATWAGSPVQGADFSTDDHKGTVLRAYSFIGDGGAWTVLVGLTGDPAVRWGNGWRPDRVIAEQPGVQVVELAR